MKELTLQLFDYHKWANERILTHIEGLPNEIFIKQLDSTFPSIAETFGHMIAVDELWYLRMQGINLEQVVPKKVKKIEDARKISKGLYHEMDHFLETTENIESAIFYKNTKGEPFNNTVQELIQHIVNHGSYHRGGISAMIRQLGYKGIEMDYTIYLRRK